MLARPVRGIDCGFPNQPTCPQQRNDLNIFASNGVGNGNGSATDPRRVHISSPTRQPHFKSHDASDTPPHSPACLSLSQTPAETPTAPLSEPRSAQTMASCCATASRYTGRPGDSSTTRAWTLRSQTLTTSFIRLEPAAVAEQLTLIDKVRH
ncbi:unnamed protein product [Protopolystoma xenopodis]|uniref:Uncharacterized protein n=1 Tax=Protopolystoma xenopodis TaxID=117903 RepID=A0A448XSZ5_9PLAT|nr:unnamed protein product [Protopolystoma xenopodis]